MLIIEIKNNENIEKALKTLKSKVIKTKQNQQLMNRKEFIKQSVEKRAQKLKAIYKQRKLNDALSLSSSSSIAEKIVADNIEHGLQLKPVWQDADDSEM